MGMQALRSFIVRYQHELSIASFVVGFAIDSMVLKRIDLLISNVVLYSYLVIVVVVMTLLHSIAAYPRMSDSFSHKEWLPFVAQFAFGGMFSGFLIFYSQSGSLVASWPFMALILALIITNEFLRSYHTRLAFQTTLLFFCLFSFAIYTVPIFMGTMGGSIFIGSGVLALVLVLAFVGFLALVGYRRVLEAWRRMAIGIGLVYVVINTLYFTNILPPIPLALKTIGVYHRVEKVGEVYTAESENAPWWNVPFFRPKISIGPNESLFVYSSVFAPTKLQTSVVHEWQYYDKSKGSWVTASTIWFPIAGGRDGGYRGYSEKTLIFPATWRVNVETERGQLIGRTSFTVARLGSAPKLETRILY